MILYEVSETITKPEIEFMLESRIIYQQYFMYITTLAGFCYIRRHFNAPLYTPLKNNGYTCVNIAILDVNFVYFAV